MSLKEGEKFISEDELRTQVIHKWLKDCGLSENQILIETSIKIQLGKGIKIINSRADVLVKSLKGDNLLIIEVKAPNHQLDTKDFNQALSYSRSLAEGGIAPFTIITNGKDNMILDSISGDEISRICIPKDHKYILNGFRPTGDAIKARAEALDYLISLSSENLLEFCKAQVHYRMDLLKSNDIFSGKKYIPELYVDRTQTNKDLQSKLFDKRVQKQLVLVVGPPQHGKTCFMCHSVEKYLAEGVPCLFYPAISLKNGLFDEICSDFEWTFSETLSPIHLIKRLDRITSTSDQRFIIFIDGWNEMLSQALILNDECQRLQNTKIQIVLSTTSPSLNRLLQDESGNPAYIASTVNLNLATIKKLTVEPLNYTKDLGLVQIGGFNYTEVEEGRKKHESAYNVVFSKDSNLPKDPFYLRLAAEEYANNCVPTFATRTGLIHNSLIRKSLRRSIGQQSLLNGLNKLAEIILQEDTPFNCTQLPTELNNDYELSKWKESAILIEIGNTEIPQIDFYYTHDKDFSIAILNRNWSQKLRPGCDILKELNYVIRNEAGKSALQWFLSCPENSDIIENIFPLLEFESTKNIVLTKIVASSIVNQVVLNKRKVNWIEKYLSTLLSSQKYDDQITSEIAHLIYSLLMSTNKREETNNYEFWIKWLLFFENDIEDMALEESLTINLFGELEIRSYDGYGNDIVADFDINLFEKLLYDENETIAYRAGLILSYSCPKRYLSKVPSVVNYHKGQDKFRYLDIVYQPCYRITSDLFEAYYGSMCPGWFDAVEKGDEEIRNEFIEQKKLWSPILKLLDTKSALYNRVIEILNTLAEYALIKDEEKDYQIDPDQLSLF